MARRTGHPSALVHSLGRIARDLPLTPKLLVASSFGEGSEILRALTLQSGGWIGFEVTTPGRLALRVASVRLAAEGRRVLDGFAESALVDEVLDEVLDEGDWRRVRVVAEAAGFRDAVARALGLLRLHRVEAETAGGGSRDAERRRLLAAVLSGYTGRLFSERLVDPAAVFETAIAELRGPRADALHGLHVILVPGLVRAGLAGAFVETLQASGAMTLTADGVVGVGAPPAILWQGGTPRGRGAFLFAPERAPEPGGGPVGSKPIEIELFSAASVRDELREVLRRAMQRGLPWDEVEIVTPDADAYGAALHSLGLQLDVPCSFGVGLSIDRTRPGRAIAGYLRWIEGGFTAEGLRILLEAGDLSGPSDHARIAPARLARRLRELEVGWGRDRYRPAIERAREQVRSEEERDREPTEARIRSRERRLDELAALEATVRHLDRATPWAPDPLRREGGSVSPAELADGVLAFLNLVPKGQGADEVARRDLKERLGRIRRTLRRPTTFESAIAILRKHLHIRVRAAWDEGSPPWKSTGGHIHLTDLAHGGLTGRRATFVVGLDDGRFPGAGHQDPVLLDSDRESIDADLPSSGHSLALRRFQLAVVASRVRGLLTLSYTAWDAREARVLQPSPVLLDAFRLKTGHLHANYADLSEALGVPRSACPALGASPVDGDDVWLAALGREGFTAGGETSVRQAFPKLNRGLDALEAAELDHATPFRGLVVPRPELLDPRRSGTVVSASRLEILGGCPLHYFYRYGIGLRPPDEPQPDPERWLDPLHRGSLLHRVFEETLSRFPDGSSLHAEEAVVDAALDVLSTTADALRQRLPAPTEAVYRAEIASLGGDIRSWARTVAESGPEWVALELGFGWDHGDPVELTLPGGSLALGGAVDRVDRRADGLTVVDYKTGMVFGFGVETGVFRGGRRLQHVLYAEAVEKLLDEAVEGVEYHFPTPRGRNDVRRFDREALRSGLGLVDVLLDQAAEGRFLPTDDSNDCRLCDFKPVCRVTGDQRLHSPPAEWGSRNIATLTEYEGLRAVRGWEDDS